MNGHVVIICWIIDYINEKKVIIKLSCLIEKYSF